MRGLLVMGLLAGGLLQPPMDDPPTEEDPVKADLKKLEGVWSVTAAESSGLKASAETAQGTRIAIALRRGGLIMAPCPANVDPKAALDELRKSNDLSRTSAFAQTYVAARTVRLNPTKKPKEMELAAADRTILAIYELSAKGDELRICGDDQAKARPTDFTAPSGSGRSTIALKKVYTPPPPAKPAEPAEPPPQ